MKVLRIEIDDNTMKRIDKLAPADSRKRSAFIREAIQRALWEVEERGEHLSARIGKIDAFGRHGRLLNTRAGAGADPITMPRPGSEPSVI